MFFHYAKIGWVENPVSFPFIKNATEKINDISGRKRTTGLPSIVTLRCESYALIINFFRQHFLSIDRPPTTNFRT